MRALLTIALIIVVGLVAAFALGLLNIDQTRTARLPGVKVEGGQMPGFDVKAGKIEMGTTNTSVDVPTVGTRRETVSVPTIGVHKAEK